VLPNCYVSVTFRLSLIAFYDTFDMRQIDACQRRVRKFN
jgi:hypothetical protein